MEHADEVSYLLIQVKNITGRVRDSHHPLQLYPRSQILENKGERERQRDNEREKLKKNVNPRRAGYEMTGKAKEEEEV